MTIEPSSPRRRADAQRNRERILAAAREAFGEAAGEASMAEISRRAGVGMATLYRNFPGRRELLEALYADEVDALCSVAETGDGAAPGERFEIWLRRFFDYFTGKRAIASALLEHVAGDDALFDSNRARVMAAGEPLLAAAQRAGEVRDDLTLEQILDLTIAVAKLQGEAGYVEAILRAALDGLRPRAPG
jgi:AcrR family transcriptional regulator